MVVARGCGGGSNGCSYHTHNNNNNNSNNNKGVRRKFWEVMDMSIAWWWWWFHGCILTTHQGVYMKHIQRFPCQSYLNRVVLKKIRDWEVGAQRGRGWALRWGQVGIVAGRKRPQTGPWVAERGLLPSLRPSLCPCRELSPSFLFFYHSLFITPLHWTECGIQDKGNGCKQEAHETCCAVRNKLSKSTCLNLIVPLPGKSVDVQQISQIRNHLTAWLYLWVTSWCLFVLSALQQLC